MNSSNNKKKTVFAFKLNSQNTLNKLIGKTKRKNKSKFQYNNANINVSNITKGNNAIEDLF